ncbi:hypothetical protein NLI96_g249 [Meripilus lineatus]|uniref:Uncharacterized protein n=1 Tax=Meripilus lineatus TaxID=2056292 RepID=A0AAD5VCQ8_9APHY|nr:hypothetical protein NLI96_g249 [Physisporinus lineatus]
MPVASSSNATSSSGSLTSPVPPASPPPTNRNNLADSQQMVDESFMLLGHRSETNDAFNQFWKITEGMLNYLSQPVAFATAPLGPPENSTSLTRREPGSSSDTDIEDPISRRISRGVGFMKSAKSKVLSRHGSSNASDSDSGRPGINTFPPKPAPIDDWDDDVEETYDDMADSFCLIPSKTEPSLSILKKENSTLKADLEEAQKQLALAERTLKQRKEQDLQLRDSIMLARKEAQRAMSSSMAIRPPVPPPPVDLSALSMNPPPVPAPVAALNPSRDREAQLLRRIRELEDDLRSARVENEKQKAMIVKFRERWEKLKESAKRKKQAKAAAEATNVVADRIDEEPEAEAEAERNDSKPHAASDSLITG